MLNIFEYRNQFEDDYIDNVTEFDYLEVRLFTERSTTNEVYYMNKARREGNVCVSYRWEEQKRSTTNEACNQDYICEFLITYGGPTVRFTVDSRYPMAELFHSWGVDHSGNRKETIEVNKNVTNNFKQFIEDIYNA